MKKIRLFIILFFIAISIAEAETSYDYLSQKDFETRNEIVKALKNGDTSAYQDYLVKNPALINALEICKKGLSKRLQWDTEKQKYVLIKKSEQSKYGIGKSLIEFLERTKTIVVFTDGYGSKSSTGGGEINGSWEEGELSAIGSDEKEKYKIRKFNVIWISGDLKRSPAAISMIMAHEFGHGIACEYRDNFPLPLDHEEWKKPPYIYFPRSQEDDDDVFCYPFEGMMAEELGLATDKNMDLKIQNSTKFEDDAAKWYKEIIGGIDFMFPELYNKLRMATCLSRKQLYLSKKHHCGMRCKNFGKYGFCDRETIVKPCYQWSKHIQTWFSSDSPDNK